jgi:hypothetical protein
MLQDWRIQGKHGSVIFPQGEVVYQTKGVVIEPVYISDDGRYYIVDTDEKFIEINGEQYLRISGRRFIDFEGGRYVAVASGNLMEVYRNSYNGYCYRQDGK